MTFHCETDGTFTASYEDYTGEFCRFHVEPQWVNGELQLKLSSKLTREDIELDYFYPETVMLTKAVDFTRPGGMEEPTEPGGISSIPDGTYSLKLTGEFTDVSGGVMAKGHVQELITFTDAEVQNLRPGDVLPLSRYAYTGPEYDGMYRYADIALKTVTTAASGTRIFLNEELWLVKEDDGLWYLEAPSGAYYEVLTKAVEVYIPNTCPIVDWSTNQEQRPDSIRKVAKSALWYGGEFKIENGSVTNVRIYYNFNA